MRDRFIDDYLAYLLARASMLISREFHDRLTLSVPTWRALATLFDGDGMTVGRLADFMLMKAPTLTKIVDRLERDELVRRDDVPGDRRKCSVFITPKGVDLVRGLIGDAKDHEAQVLRNVPPEQVKVLKDALRTLITQFETDEKVAATGRRRPGRPRLPKASAKP